MTNDLRKDTSSSITDRPLVERRFLRDATSGEIVHVHSHPALDALVSAGLLTATTDILQPGEVLHGARTTGPVVRYTLTAAGRIAAAQEPAAGHADPVADRAAEEATWRTYATEVGRTACRARLSEEQRARFDAIPQDEFIRPVPNALLPGIVYRSRVGAEVTEHRHAATADTDRPADR